MFPSLLPKVADTLWFNVDRPCDDESELSKMEEEHAAWVGLEHRRWYRVGNRRLD